MLSFTTNHNFHPNASNITRPTRNTGRIHIYDHANETVKEKKMRMQERNRKIVMEKNKKIERWDRVTSSAQKTATKWKGRGEATANSTAFQPNPSTTMRSRERRGEVNMGLV